jgi:hypothetical protein
MSDRKKPTGEWHALRVALEKAGGGIDWRRAAEILFSVERPGVVLYRFRGGVTVWRYGSQSELRRDPPPALTFVSRKPLEDMR